MSSSTPDESLPPLPPLPSLSDEQHRSMDSSRSSLASSESSTSLATPPSTYALPAPSAPGILRTASSSISTLSCNGEPNSTPFPTTTSLGLSVTFAPLPTVDARRRNSSVQMGIAARSRLLRQRRLLREQAMQEQQDPPLPPPRYPKQVPVWREDVECDENDEPISDPALDALVALGRLVRGASKSLWKQMKNKDGKGKTPPAPLHADSLASREDLADGRQADPDGQDDADEKATIVIAGGASFADELEGALRGDDLCLPGVINSQRWAGDVRRKADTLPRALPPLPLEDAPTPEVRRSASFSIIPRNGPSARETRPGAVRRSGSIDLTERTAKR